jgi:hypothetical protein
MQTLRDAATLAILVLLALTVRVSLDGEPLTVDLGTAAEAAQEPAVAEFFEPAGFALLPDLSKPCDESARTLTRRVTLPLRPEAAAEGGEREPIEWVWESGEKRIVIVLRGEDPVETAVPAPESEPCAERCRARVSC